MNIETAQLPDKSCLLYHVIAGSHLYGTNNPDSDTDHIKVCQPSDAEIYSMGDKVWSNKHQVSHVKDVQTHSMHKFLDMLVKGNANAIEALFVPVKCVRHCTVAFSVLTFTPRVYLNRGKVFKGHLGFASGQIKKMACANTNPGTCRCLAIERDGYDRKYAAHALRLVWQLNDLLKAGRLIYPLSAKRREILQEISAGGLTLQQVESKSKKYTVRCEQLQVRPEHEQVIKDTDTRAYLHDRLLAFYEKGDRE